MAILNSIAQALFGCGLLGFACFSQPIHHSVTVDSYLSTSTPNAVTVVTTINGNTTKQVLPAPYGVKTSVIETYTGTNPVTEASTTPLTQADIQQMQEQEFASEKQIELMQQQMDQVFADQQRLLSDVWGTRVQ
jgi:hypothetical protein